MGVGLTPDAFLGFREESTWGTAVTVASPQDVVLFTNESLAGADQLRSPPTIVSPIDKTADSYIGREIASGGVTFPVPYEGVELLFLHMMGELNNASGAGPYERDFDLSDRGRFGDANGPSLTLFLSRGIVDGSSDFGLFKYAGMVVDSFSFSCSQDGHLELTINFFGKEETFAATAVTKALPQGPVAHGLQCTKTWGGNAIPYVRDFTINVNRGVDKERFGLGSANSLEPPMAKYEVTAQLTTEWDNATIGSTTMRTDYKAGTARALKFAFASTTEIPTHTGEYYNLDLELPSAKIETFPPQISSAGRVLVNTTFRGYGATPGTAPQGFRIHSKTQDNFTDS